LRHLGVTLTGLTSYSNISLNFSLTVEIKIT
jgi:hypothetical protein